MSTAASWKGINGSLNPERDNRVECCLVGIQKVLARNSMEVFPKGRACN